MEVRRASFTWNQALEEAGEPSCFLDCLIFKDGEVLMDVHESFKTRQEFMEAISKLPPTVPSIGEVTE